MKRGENDALKKEVFREVLAELRARRREREQRVSEKRLWDVLADRWGYPIPRRRS